MNDTYAEYLIKRKTPFTAHLVNAMMVILTLLSLFLAITFNLVAILLFCAVSFCSYLVIRNSFVEFEYLFLDNRLSVDQILGRSKRKTICDISMADIQLVAPSESPELNDYRGGKKNQIVDFGSHQPHAKTWTAIVQNGSVRREVIFEPNGQMLECMYRSAPRKVKK